MDKEENEHIESEPINSANLPRSKDIMSVSQVYNAEPPPENSMLVQEHVSSGEIAIQSEQLKDEIYTAAESTESVPVTLVVKICWTLAALTVVSLVAFVCHALLQTQSHDANLEEKIMSGNKAESLRALKQQSVQSYFTIFVMVIVVLVLLMSAGFGYLLFYKDAAKHDDHQKQQIVRKALKAVDTQEGKIMRLTADRDIQMVMICQLEKEVRGFETQIEEMKNKDVRNEEEIKLLMEQKMEKQAKLAASNEILRNTEKRLEETKERANRLEKDKEKVERSNAKLEQNLANENARILRLSTDLSREQAEVGSLRNRTRDLERSEGHFRSRMYQLECDKTRLQEEVKRKPTTIIKSRTFFI